MQSRNVHFEVSSDRQCSGTASVEAHRVVKVGHDGRLVVAIFRRRDMAEELCGEFNKPLGYVASAVVLMELAEAA